MAAEAELRFTAALEAHQRGEFERAESVYAEELQHAPTNTYVLCLLARLYSAMGRTDQAAASLRAAKKSVASPAYFYGKLSIACVACGDYGKALVYGERAVAADPVDPELRSNLVRLLINLGKTDRAAKLCHRAQGPQLGSLLNELGCAFRAQGRHSDAANCFRRAARMDSGSAIAWSNLGATLALQGEVAGAVRAYRHAVTRQPEIATIHNSLGNVLFKLGHMTEAAVSFRQALRCQPGSPEVHNNLAATLACVGRVREAIGSYREALRHDPAAANTHSSLLCTLLYDPDTTPEEVFIEHVAWGRQHADRLERKFPDNDHDFSPERKLRVGYMSAGFRQTASAHFLEPIAEWHDPNHFEVFCYSDHRQRDHVTARFKRSATAWRDTHSWSDSEIAEQVARDGIDILVDENGHFGTSRLLVFARSPAPLAVSLATYPSTTGLAAMDFRITSAIAAPVGVADRWHTEALVRLPETFACYRPRADSPSVNGLPALRSGMFTFGCSCRVAKISADHIAAWAEILRRSPRSRMLVQLGEEVDRNRDVGELIFGAFRQNGIGPSRIELVGCLSAQDHLKIFREIDLGLDTSPYNGMTITCESLWMGVPVVTLAGQSHVSRVGASLLSCVGLERLTTTSTQEYVDTAVAVAAEIERLAELRGSLRRRMADSPLTDGRTFTRNLEAAYRDMWRLRCAR